MHNSRSGVAGQPNDKNNVGKASHGANQNLDQNYSRLLVLERRSTTHQTEIYNETFTFEKKVIGAN